MKQLLVIVGPTGAGKSALALSIAARVGGEIVSADSQQVYRGMDIGTGKVTPSERARVPHHCIDVAEPTDEMTAARFAELADAAIASTWRNDRPVIVCGGTGLYIRALLLGFFPSPPVDATIRTAVQNELAARGAPALHADLCAIDPAMAARVNPNDAKRITRALEVFRATGRPLSSHWEAHDHRAVPPRYDATWVGLAPPRAAVYAAIEARVDAMVAGGWVDEVATLRARGVTAEMRSQDALGYRELHAVCEGTQELRDVLPAIKQRSRNYARRQLSWFRAERGTQWFESAAAVDVSAWERYVTTRG